MIMTAESDGFTSPQKYGTSGTIKIFTCAYYFENSKSQWRTAVSYSLTIG